MHNDFLIGAYELMKFLISGREQLSTYPGHVGEVMTMEQCLYGMMLESANECAYAIAKSLN